MSTNHDGTAGRPLPPGLRICETCGVVRGTSADGSASACYCSGLVCKRCGGRARRPITDYYDPVAGHWWHVPYFHLRGHRCDLAPGDAPSRAGWTSLQPDPDVLGYQRAMTELALSLMDEDTELDIVDGDRPLGRMRLGRPS